MTDSYGDPRAAARRWRVPLIGLAGLSLGLYALFVGTAMDGDQARSDLLMVQIVLLGWSFVTSGIIALRKRPANRVGLLLAATGLAFLAAEVLGLVPSSNLAFSVALLIGQLFLAPLAHLLLAFPTGRLSTKVERAVIGVTYIWVGFLGNALRALVLDPVAEGLCQDCTNIFMIRNDPSALGLLATLDALVGAVLAVFITAIMVRRWRAASGPMRRVLRPVWWGLWSVLLGVAYLIALDLFDVPLEFQYLAVPYVLSVFTVLPILFLVGLLRTRLDRSLVGEFLVELQGPMAHGQLRGALSEALGDPSLRLAFWLPQQGRYVDEEGRGLQLPEDTSEGHHLTDLADSEGNPLAVLIHDPALLEDNERVEAVASAARLALENERLHAELQAQLQELRESRARIVEAGDHARQRLERDLHDGAQQRLLALSIAIERARTLGEEAHEDRLDDLLTEASSQIRETLAELRELARGIHPALLTDEGLGPAVEALARRASLPTTVLNAPIQRFTPTVEAAAYFIVSEALANAAKHSKASEATVSIENRDGWLEVVVADDGVGGARFDGGSGLLGLEDRVVSLGGELAIQSSPETGTRIKARIPRDHNTPAPRI